MSITTALPTAEWTKIRSVRSTRWALLAMIVLSLGFSILVTAVYSHDFGTLDASDRTWVLTDPVGLIFQPGATFGQIAAVVLGVLAITSEFSSGTIRLSLLATPRRWPLLAAKAGVFAALVFVVGELIAVPAVLAGRGLLKSHVAVDPGNGLVIRAMLGFGLYLAVTGTFAMAVGSIVRHTGAAITAAIALVIVVPNVLQLIPGNLGDHLPDYVPGGSAGQAMMSTGHDPTATVSPLTGLLVSVGWTLLALLLAAWVLRRRDVSGT